MHGRPDAVAGDAAVAPEAATDVAPKREAKFVFRELQGKPFAPFEDKEIVDLLNKW